MRHGVIPSEAKRVEGFPIASRELQLLALFSPQVSPAASQKRRAGSGEKAATEGFKGSDSLKDAPPR